MGGRSKTSVTDLRMPSVFSFYNSDENSRPKHQFLDNNDHPEAGDVDSFFVNIAATTLVEDL
ncbi:uncharacterized protein N7506_009768 [Penicillium brevicompactum]|uniref:uncharacterized protein n=1 Tax=Penicillium brevicompactum TaxID=5074 RepID=UPI0025405B5D|nr:uncharacterized protein N7506_009768 [Penicillium brevicompactum]KAJ5326666.1 hypothetical protein N7506_009768 [Penicillium brevicompactum]